MAKTTKRTGAKRRPSKKQGTFRSLGVQFIKLQIAGNIPFWGTYLLFALFDKVFYVDVVLALFVATILANGVFFIVGDRWVFATTRSKRKTASELLKFVVFTSFTAVLSFFITWQMHEILAVTPYIGQFITAAFMMFVTFVGLRFWVFAAPRTRSKA